jgi:hypothetical protein
MEVVDVGMDLVGVGALLVGTVTLVVAVLTLRCAKNAVQLAEARNDYLLEEQKRLDYVREERKTLNDALVLERQERWSLQEHLNREHGERLEAQRRAEQAEQEALRGATQQVRLPIITGDLVGLVAPVLVVVATVGANVISNSRDALRATKKKVSRQAITTYSRVGTDAAVMQMPERRKRDAEVRRTA